MSVLAYVRVRDQRTLEFEGQVLGLAYDLFEQAQPSVGKPNPHSFMVDEDVLMTDDEVDELEESADDDEDFEAPVDRELSRRGEFFEREAVLASLRGYLDHFRAHPEARGQRTRGIDVAKELSELIEVIEDVNGPLRLYVG